MTDYTDPRGYPFPECDPPLVKDRSDISTLRDLAVAVDADAQTADNTVVQFYEKPDAAKITCTAFAQAVPGAASGDIWQVPYNTLAYQTYTGMTLLSSDALIVRRRGLYMVSSWVLVTNTVTVDQGLMIRHKRNNLTFQEGRRFEGPASEIVITSPYEASMTTTDVMLCEAGDVIQTQVKTYTPTLPLTFSVTSSLAMIQLQDLDV